METTWEKTEMEKNLAEDNTARILMAFKTEEEERGKNR